MRVIIETSARHVHLSKADFEALFGIGATLEFSSSLSQPGQFISRNRISILGVKNTTQNVAILGPFRNKTQVEISITDAIKLGIKPVIRESGDIENTAGCILESKIGKVNLKSGVIVAKRHIHMTPQDAQKCGLNDHDVVKIFVENAERKLIFDDVIVRVDKNFSTAMHIDTDEANAAGIFGTTYGEIII